MITGIACGIHDPLSRGRSGSNVGLDDLGHPVVQRGAMRSLLSHLRPYLPENPEVLISHRLDRRFPLSLAVWSAVRARPEKGHEELFNPHRSGARRGGAGSRHDGDRADRSSTSTSGQMSWRFATKKYRKALPGDVSSRAKPRRRAVAKAQCVSTSRSTTASLWSSSRAE